MIKTLVYRDSKLVIPDAVPERLAELRADPAIMLWVDLAETNEEEARRILAEVFAIHPLTIEDCLQETPLPKYELYDDYLYFVLHAVDYTRAGKFTTVEVDFILGRNFLITLHRRPLRPVEVARDRALRAPNILVRGPDRLAHNVIDLLVDHYQPALAELRAEVERVEETVLERGRGGLESQIIELRADLAALRQIMRPQRELVAELAQGRIPFIRRKMLPYLRDARDEFVRIEEVATAWSDQTMLIFRVYLNRASHEANRGIRVLTALTAVMLPMFIIGGWFGMNFNKMPLVPARAAYWGTLAVTVGITAALLVLLRKRRWF